MPACDDQAETIASLSRPETYGIAGAVERIDTHAAIVFLAGDRAFKLKRSVRYPYLDFSTVEKRRAVCEAELALNRRTAPGLYLEVLPLGRLPDGQLALGEGTPVDWLVVMRRFGPDCLLDVMAQRGRLEPGLIRDLAAVIAAFHATAEVVPGGGADRLRAVIEGNRASMAAQGEGLLPSEVCARLHKQSLALLEELAPLLDRRAATGHVRHGHGDLHLANICLWHGRPLPFDCLEFDDNLAIGDVFYDLAFLLMDLWYCGLHGEASLLLNRYCDLRGEGEGLAAMPLFLATRAAVRAHVEASAAGLQAEAARREAKRDTARAYLAAALTFLERQPPRLIAIGGLSGSGKSTLAGALAPHVGGPPGARWLRTDVLRKRLAGISPEAALPPEAYTPANNRAIYARLMEQASTVLAAGVSVIADGVFADPAERAAIADVATTAGVPFAALWLEAPRERLYERVGVRRGDASDADATVVDRQLGYDLGDLSTWQRIRAEGTPGQVLAAALARITGDTR